MKEFWAKHRTAITILGVFGAVILVRALFTDSVYPASTGDTADHLAVIDAISKGDWGSWAYLGEVIVGVPVLLASKVFGLDTASVFLAVEYLLLFGIGWSLYFTVSRLVNQKAGILAVLLALLCTPSVFRLFSSGTIFSIANMFLILPFALYFTVRWLTTKKWRYAVSAALLFALFGVFHPNSLSLLFAGVLFFCGYAVYRWLKGCRREALAGGLAGLCALGVVAFANLLLAGGAEFPVGEMLGRVGTALSGAFQGVSNTTGHDIVGLGQFTFSFLTPAVLGVLCVAVVGLIQYRKSVKLSMETKLFLAMLLAFLPFLAVGTFTGVAIDPWRHAVDLSTILAVIAACLSGILLTVRKSRVFTVIILGITALGMVPTLSIFFEFQGVG